MQRNANIEQTNEMNKEFFVISQRVKQIFAVYCKYAKISKKLRFCRFYGFLCKNAVPCLSPEKKLVPQGDFVLNCILNSYKDCFILFMVRKNIASGNSKTYSIDYL